MNFADLLIKTTRDQANRAILNNASDLCIGTMSGTDSVTLENGYTIGGSMLSFSQFCYDQVVELPYKDYEAKSHKHTISEALSDKKAFTSSGDSVFFLGLDTNVEGSSPDEISQSLSSIIADNANITTLSLQHDHSETEELPKIRLWRGVKDGDSVLVLKVNTRHFVVLCRLGAVTNEEDEECKGYDPINT